MGASEKHDAAFHPGTGPTPRGVCAEPGPRDLHCTDQSGHRYSHYDAGADESWNDSTWHGEKHACSDPNCLYREEDDRD